MSNSRPAWDVPEIGEPKSGVVRLPSESSERGTMSGAHLVTDYFAVEYRTKEPIRWRIPRRSNKLELLRQRLVASKAKWGTVLQTGIVDRPNAGKPLVGPLPIPEHRPRPSLACTSRHAVSPDFTMPSDQLHVPGLTWAFRTMFYRREMDRTPLYSCTGLETPRKEA